MKCGKMYSISILKGYLSMKVLFTAINAKFLHTNIAVRYLNKICKENGEFDTSYAEYTINNSKDIILQELIEQSPDVIAFSCYLWNVGMVCDISKCLRKVAPNIKIIFGGPEVSFYESTENLPCDYLIKGEGENLILPLLRNISKGKQTENIIESKEAFDINKLPFPYENELTYLPNRTLYYEASRGCPFRCAYCLSGSEYGVRFKDLDIIKKELKIFMDAKVRQVKFVDRTFNCNKKICKSVWNYIKENNNGITNFHFEISADLIDDEMMDIILSMPQGLIQLEVGVQSTNLKTLKAINRTTNLEKLFEKTDKINKSGNVHLHLDLIAGLPYEDINSFRKSFNDVFSHKPQQLQLGMLKLLKGSALYSQYKNYSMEFCHYPPYEILSTHVLPYNDLIKLKKVEEVTELFYNSGRFENTLYYLINSFPSAFDFFFALGHFYFDKNYHLIPLSKDGQYNCLKLFHEEKIGEITDKFRELIRFDMISHEKPKKIPQWAEGKRQISRNEMLEFLRNEENTKKYLPKYKDFAPKDIMAHIHIEAFDYDMTSTEKEEKPVILLFDYNKRCILGRAETVKINL